jgi:hypothetical protein
LVHHPTLELPRILQITCRCELCAELNAFLRSPTLKSTVFANAGARSARRTHIQERIAATPGASALLITQNHTGRLSVYKLNVSGFK